MDGGFEIQLDGGFEIQLDELDGVLVLLEFLCDGGVGILLEFCGAFLVLEFKFELEHGFWTLGVGMSFGILSLGMGFGCLGRRRSAWWIFASLTSVADETTLRYH